VLSNRKEKHRKGKIQLIDARERWAPMKRSLGNKRRWLDEKAIDEVTREHGALTESKTSKVFVNADFGYRRVSSSAINLAASASGGRQGYGDGGERRSGRRRHRC
jgi:type I restriction-modification system DNA methylase subunit